MHLHLAAILPVCETFNPILKQTIAQPKDWKLHFPALASALGNLGNYDLSWLCSGAERRQAAPAGGWALLSSCHVIPAEMSHLGSVEGAPPALEGAQEFHSLLCTEAPAELWKMSLRWKFAGVSFEQPHSTEGTLRRMSGLFSLQNAAQGKALWWGLIPVGMGNWLGQTGFENNLL